MALLFQLTQKLAHGFQGFWDRYPRREAKKDATKAWTQLAPTPELEQEIHKALDWQMPLWEEREKKFIPLPATYLRGERWTDEPPTPPKPKSATVSRHTATPMAVQQLDAATRIRALVATGMTPEQAKQAVYREMGWVK